MDRPPTTVPEYPINGRKYRCPFADLLRPPTHEEEQALAADIAANGVITPLVATEDDEILDGVTRLRIAIALGLTQVPVRVVPGLTAPQKRAMALNLNLLRRHLSRKERRELIAAELKADPARSNAAVATVAGASDKTVAAVRQELESTSEIPRLEATVGQDGRQRKSHPPRKAAASAKAVAKSGPGGPMPKGPAAETPASPRGSEAAAAATCSSYQPHLFDAAPEADLPPEPAPPPVAPPRQQSGWVRDLRDYEQRCAGLTRELGRLSRAAVPKRSPAEVRDVAGRLRRVVDELDRMAAALPSA
jgi:ParB-like chromosome segregation protein Spo0J